MARPREFDEEEVLSRAVEHFWQYGFEATSIRDLATATKLTTASLYNAFGDKRAIYSRALTFYVERSFGDRVQRFGKLPPKDAINAFFCEIVARSLSDADRKGCMLVNSALEVAPHDTEFLEVIAKVLTQVEAFFKSCLTNGQEDGTISRRQTADHMAGALLGTLLGVRVLARTRPEKELLEGMIKPVLSLLEPDIVSTIE
ncbi:TetR/AcrR family transcriptional regulator [Brucella intermedia]|uniref:TetR/AcrR family transcriptional regulator n=1 Tax=Brucella intermedia TaxID=94625 RepID=UPI003AB5F280